MKVEGIPTDEHLNRIYKEGLEEIIGLVFDVASFTPSQYSVYRRIRAILIEHASQLNSVVCLFRGEPANYDGQGEWWARYIDDYSFTGHSHKYVSVHYHPTLMAILEHRPGWITYYGGKFIYDDSYDNITPYFRFHDKTLVNSIPLPEIIFQTVQNYVNRSFNSIPFYYSRTWAQMDMANRLMLAVLNNSPT